ncbi:hypothetical protein, partial [Plebeiibacterium marinum]
MKQIYFVLSAVFLMFTVAVSAQDTIQVYGCTDILALNYDSLATVNDGSCEYSTTDTISTGIPGCMDVLALNYDSLATVSDGSCEYSTTD